MHPSSLLALIAALPPALTQQTPDETVLGVYIFHRHGDRTPKVLAPTNLTDLGYRQTYQSGQYYRSRYIASDADYRIAGVTSDEVLQSQISVLAPDDDVLQQSAVAFLQALYPPVGVDSETLANGSTVDAPMNGYQIIPVGQSETGAGSEDASWLQRTSECGQAVISSNEYYASAEYNALLDSTREFYERLAPVISLVFDEEDRNFDNAYTSPPSPSPKHNYQQADNTSTVYDYINVATIHNTSIPSSTLLNSDVLLQLRTLADNHEWNLAYNRTTPIRAISGSQLAGEITQYLNSTISAADSLEGPKIGVQFGAYATFMSFFGLADLDEVDEDFTGVTDYASSMVFEMFTNASSTAVTSANYPSENDIFVRFLYHNGTASNKSQPEAYPLFGSGQNELRWSDFMDGMNGFSIGDAETWCHACGNTTGSCAAYAPVDASPSPTDSRSDVSGGCSDGVSPAVNGVIGAMVTLAVVLGIEGLIMLVGGFRVVKKRSLASGGGAGPDAAAMGGEGKA